MYCDKCRLIVEENICPVCGNKKLKVPQPDDDCFLVEKEMMWGEMLIDILNQNSIPFHHTNVLGAALALNVGLNRERFRFYVPFSFLKRAQSLVEEVFPAPETEQALDDPDEAKN